MAASLLTSHMGYWLRYVSNHVSHAFARKLEGHDVTVAEWVVLRELFDGENIAPSRLAEKLGLTRGAISKLADRLIDKGLVARLRTGVEVEGAGTFRRRLGLDVGGGRRGRGRG